jgi:hypothetical protein
MDHSDKPVLAHIRIAYTRNIGYSKGEHGLVEDAGSAVNEGQVQYDQCWACCASGEALRSAGQNPDMAQVRPPQVVESYQQY